VTQGATKSYQAIILSVLVHCALLIVIIMQVNNGAEKKRTHFDKNIPPKAVISAKLIVMPKIKPPIKKIKSDTKKPIQKKQQLVSPKKIVKPNKDKPPVVKSVKKSNPDIIKAVPEIAPEPVQTKTVKALTKPAETANNKTVISRPKSVTDNVKTSALSTMDLSRKLLQSQISQAPIYNAEYENGSMSVMNNNLRQHEYTEIDISFEEKRLVKITCDSTAKKVTAVLADFMGGTLRCEPGPDLSKFIKQKPKPKFKYKLDQ